MALNTGNMKNSVIIYRNIETQNSVGEVELTRELFLNIKAEVQFDRTVDSESKFDSSWCNRLVIRTRFARSMMPVIDSRDGFAFEFQGKVYRLINYDMWNQVQRYITFYVEVDNG